MTLVEHVIKGKKYVYDHHRVGDETVSTYIGPSNQVVLQDRIQDSKSLRDHPDYLHAHMTANKAEQKEYGSKRFDKLNEEINKLSDKELAGRHTKEGELKVSTKIDKKFLGQVLFHERIEHNIMVNKNKHKNKQKKIMKTAIPKDRIKDEKEYHFTRNQILNIVDAAEGTKGSCKYAKEFIKILKKEEKIEIYMNNKKINGLILNETKKKCCPVKILKDITDEITVSNYVDFYSSVCAKNRKWLLKNVGRP